MSRNKFLDLKNFILVVQYLCKNQIQAINLIKKSDKK